MARCLCRKLRDGFSSTYKRVRTDFRFGFCVHSHLQDAHRPVGTLPVGYVKLVKGNFSAEIGELPTLIGAEYTFSFQNLNIERGLLWNQETAISRGIQLNETLKKLSLSVSWNDGFYSNRYNWISGSAAYAINSANTIAFVPGGNAGQTPYYTFATPVQNNRFIYNLIYTYSHGSWYIQPYWQYTSVPTNPNVGVVQGASTNGGVFSLTTILSTDSRSPCGLIY